MSAAWIVAFRNTFRGAVITGPARAPVCDWCPAVGVGRRSHGLRRAAAGRRLPCGDDSRGVSRFPPQGEGSPVRTAAD